MGVASVRQRVVVASVALLASGCPQQTTPAPAAPTNTTISVEVEGDTTPDLDQQQGAALPEPPAADPQKPHVAYLEVLEAPIQDRWRTFLDDCRLRLAGDHPLNDVSLSATLEIDLDPEGKLAAVRTTAPSGNDDFDKVAVEIVREIQTFPKPEADLVSDDGVAHLVWKFSRGDTQAGAGTAEISRIHWPPQRSVPRLIERGDLAEAARRVEQAAADLDQADTMQRELLIGLLNDVAIEAVREGLASEEPKLQRLGIAAARTGKLVTLGPELSKIARSAVDASMRNQAMRALGRVRFADAKPLLVEILDNGADPATASAVAFALDLLGESKKVESTASQWLSSDSEDRRWAALAMLSSVPSAATVRSLRGLLSGKKSRPEKLAAASALGVAATIKAKGAMKGLIKGLQSPDAAVRAACAQAIDFAASKGTRSRVAFRKLVPLLQDKDERARASAVSAAARLEPKRFAKELYRLDRETSVVVLGALAQVLGKVPGKDTRARLSKLAGHDDAAVRRRVARALVDLDDDKSKAEVTALLEDTDFEVRLISVGGLRDVEALAPYLDNESPAIRAAALNRLVAEQGKGKTLGEVSRRLATATLTLDRVLLAAAWLSR